MKANSRVPICRCGQRADVVTAWIDENPCRRYFGRYRKGRGAVVFCLVRCSCQSVFKSDHLWALKESEENGKVKIHRTNMLVMCIGSVCDDYVGLEVVALVMMKDVFQVVAHGEGCLPGCCCWDDGGGLLIGWFAPTSPLQVPLP
ncbi:hypothetical protein V6N11_058075 [Hibiscus sabdariffa]|uniref:Uncharacterized protein n=1 Tax=Hibiscus sabdariffa TaxID=183260 RepID=A0ABR2N7Z4_9ROSI